MVDTGAVCSVLSHRSKAQPAGPQLSGANGRSIPTWGTIRRRLSFGLRPFCDLFSRRRLQTHPRFRFLVRPRAAGRPSRPPGAGLENSETTLQDTHRHRDAVLQVRRRPLLHNTVNMIPAGLVPNHRQRRKRQTVAEAQNPQHHRDDGPPCVRQGPPPGPGQAAQGRSRVPRAGGGEHHPPFRFAMVVAAAHGPQEGGVMAALLRLPPTQPGNDT
jgi:hypothetical protein